MMNILKKSTTKITNLHNNRWSNFSKRLDFSLKKIIPPLKKERVREKKTLQKRNLNATYH